MITDELLTIPSSSATIDISIAMPFLEVGADSTGMLFRFRRTVVYCCTGSVLALLGRVAAMLGSAGLCSYVQATVGAMERRGA